MTLMSQVSRPELRTSMKIEDHGRVCWNGEFSVDLRGIARNPRLPLQ